MRAVRFTVYGKPMGKGRPRFYQGHAVTPKETRAYEKKVAECYREASSGLNWLDTPEQALTVFIRAYYEVPKSYTKKKKAECIANITKPLRKPDVDNIQKIIYDSLNGVAFTDDVKIRPAVIDAAWTEDNPRVMVSICETDEHIEGMVDKISEYIRSKE